MSHDYSGYIGIPYVKNGRDITEDGGLDCWGLLIVVFKEQYGITLPRLDALQVVDNRKTMVQQVEDFGLYNLVKPVVDTQEGDIAVFNIIGDPVHVGIILSKTHVLHTQMSAGCIVEKYTSHKWSRRLQGIYRYQ